MSRFGSERNSPARLCDRCGVGWPALHRWEGQRLCESCWAEVKAEAEN